MGYMTTAIIGAVTALASTAVGVASSVEQSNAQRQQAEYQADMANFNAQVAESNAQVVEEEGKQAKKEAYEQSLEKRQEAAQIIGQQRAQQAASGVAVDQGSALDLNLDTTEKGELDALQLYEQGLWADYSKRLDAWNLRTSAAGYEAQAAHYTQKSQQASPLLGGTTAAMGSISKINSAFSRLR